MTLWRTCRDVDALTRTDVWQARSIDPERQIERLLWRAALRNEQNEVDRAVLVEAGSHDSLTDLVEKRRLELRAHEQAVEEIASNIYEILEAAQEVERARELREQETQRLADEQRLREQLLGTDVARLAREEQDVVRSAGLVAQSQTIADLLKRSELLLS